MITTGMLDGKPTVRLDHTGDPGPLHHRDLEKGRRVVLEGRACASVFEYIER